MKKCLNKHSVKLQKEKFVNTFEIPLLFFGKSIGKIVTVLTISACGRMTSLILQTIHQASNCMRKSTVILND